MGEFGRNPANGSSHFSRAWTTVLAGGGLKHGRAIGDTGASGGTVEKMDLRKSELGKEPSLSHKQYKLLCKNGIDDESLTAREAQKLVGFIAQQGFRLWAPQLGVLKKLYREILADRETFHE
jgi:hypothetical protein